MLIPKWGQTALLGRLFGANACDLRIVEKAITGNCVKKDALAACPLCQSFLCVLAVTVGTLRMRSTLLLADQLVTASGPELYLLLF